MLYTKERERERERDRIAGQAGVYAVIMVRARFPLPVKGPWGNQRKRMSGMETNGYAYPEDPRTALTL